MHTKHTHNVSIQTITAYLLIPSSTVGRPRALHPCDRGRAHRARRALPFHGCLSVLPLRVDPVLRAGYRFGILPVNGLVDNVV